MTLIQQKLLLFLAFQKWASLKRELPRVTTHLTQLTLLSEKGQKRMENTVWKQNQKRGNQQNRGDLAEGGGSDILTESGAYKGMAAFVMRDRGGEEANLVDKIK
jgi:hypothetical protein